MPDTPAERGSPEGPAPVLTDDQIEQLRAYGTEESVSAGDVLIEEGEWEADFFLQLDGQVEAFLRRDGEKVVLAEGGRGQFGMLDLLDERPASATVVAQTDGRDAGANL